MATDFESLGARGACVRMIIYWECAAPPILTYTAIYRSFRQKEAVVAILSILVRLLGTVGHYLNKFYITTIPQKHLYPHEKGTVTKPLLSREMRAHPLSAGVGIY